MNFISMTREELAKAIVNIKKQQQKIQSAQAEIVKIVDELEAKYLQPLTIKNSIAVAESIRRSYNEDKDKE